ncbi:4-hydroxythreonine-4-phosphate dehydrogenase PdxA [Chitinimonas lacunae]|uniref:4-hydroxythreonine-4-phosphate dehydrogenase n=1 Tax=Chitinimonas lacunae TaxID=1963018 RepID=A0ABV8MQK1_9NEIS
MSRLRPIALSSGEPAGIGPELCALLDPTRFGAPLLLLGDRDLLQQRAAACGAAPRLIDYTPGLVWPADQLAVLHCPLAAPSHPGRLDHANAGYVLGLLDRAIDGCLSGEFSALVTAPLHKGVIVEAGHPDFTGHTEYLAARTHTEQVVMMLVGGGMRVALATTHLPLREVADAITPASLSRTLRILDADLRQKFGLARPRILVAGLNPHAGEGGHLGREEIDIIEPTLAALRAEGLELIGPLPADTLFNPAQLARGDAVLAMYHDQGLPVLKHASFGQGVNLTLGLPMIRTSVDHGTALDLAGSGKADPGSLHKAVELAIELALSHQKNA